MLKYLPGLKWVGKLSLEDADLLAMYGSRSASILEFGCGGSTLIFSQVCSNVISVEEDQDWINVTNKRLKFLNTDAKAKIYNYGDTVVNSLVGEVDLIFSDGSYERRKSFANRYWSKLKEGGLLIFHDTSRVKYLQQAQSFIAENISQIDHALVNTPASNGKTSNITVITKGTRPGVNWKNEENKPKWAYSEDLTVDPTKLWEYNVDCAGVVEWYTRWS